MLEIAVTNPKADFGYLSLHVHHSPVTEIPSKYVVVESFSFFTWMVQVIYAGVNHNNTWNYNYIL